MSRAVCTTSAKSETSHKRTKLAGHIFIRNTVLFRHHHAMEGHAGNSNQLDLRGPLYLGGIALNEQLPSEMWAGKLLYGFVGCVKNLVINSKPIDLAKYAKQQDSGSIRPSCHAPPNHCDSQPCLNGGNCIPGWNRFSCDCSLTDFAGPICAKAAVTLNFDGEQFMKIAVSEEYQSQAEDIGLRFRTSHANGLLFTTQSNKSYTYVIALLESGRIKVIVNLGDGNKVKEYLQRQNATHGLVTAQI